LNIYYKPLVVSNYLFPNSLPNHKYYLLYFDSNKKPELCSTNLVAHDVNWVGDIDFGFSDINRILAAFRHNRQVHSVSVVKR